MKNIDNLKLTNTFVENKNYFKLNYIIVKLKPYRSLYLFIYIYI